MNHTRLARVLGAVFLAAIGTACDSGPASPHLPLSAPTITALTITGLPGTFTVGDRIHLTARATYSDGRNESIAAQWSTKTAACAVDAAGLLTAVAEGACEVEAAVDGARAAATLRVEPSRVFTITGTVREKWGQNAPPVPFATVGILNGAASGREAVADAQGVFRFEGVPRESLELRAWSEDFDSSTETVSPTQPVAQFRLEPKLQLFARTFSSPVPGSDRQTALTFTVKYAGQATLRLRTNRYDEDAGDVGGVWVLLSPQGSTIPVINAENGTQPNVWRTWSAMVGPGTYRLEIYVRFDSATPNFYVRDVEFYCPK